MTPEELELHNVRAEMRRLTHALVDAQRERDEAKRALAHYRPEDAPPGSLTCVACGAEADAPVAWGYGKRGEVPTLMRTLNLCDECNRQARWALRKETA
jgi:hypothetical protein